jgi:phage terminase large subunit-like protein
VAERKLLQSDGPDLVEWLQARADMYKGTGGRKEAGRLLDAKFTARFKARTPAPDPVVSSENGPPISAPAVSLEQFLTNVKIERATFSARLVPGHALCRDLTVPYTWPEDDAATVARLYCEQITKGEIIACDLIRRSCQRTLDDLETGHERGLFFDPVAARNIVQWFTDFCGLKLESWEVWITTSLFAWKKPSGLRRFSEAWISVGRKNGKTTLASGIGLFGLVADQEKNAEIYSAATKKDQARLIFRDAVRAVRANPELKSSLKEFRGSNVAALLVEETDARFEPLSSDTRSMDGTRPHFVLADEVHEWESRVAWDKLTKGTIARTQPLVFGITTAGESENCFAFNKHSLAVKILNGVFDDPTTFVAVFQLDPEDDFKEEKNWPKANPNLGISIQPEALRKIFAEAEQDPSGQVAFQRYICNRWVSFKEGRSIPSDKWDRCRGADYLPDNMNPQELRSQFLSDNFFEKCWGGLDLSFGAGLGDMTCYVLLFPMGDHVTVINYCWLPEFGLLDKERAWGVPLSAWAKAGWVKLLPGDMIDPELVRKDILDLCQNGPGKIQSISFDPWQSKTIMAKLAESQVCEIIECPQRPSDLTESARAFKQSIWNGTLWHLNNPVLRWHAGNVVLEEDENTGGMRPKKLSPHEKIDAVQATLTAWHGYLGTPKISSWDGIIKLLD